MRRVKNRNNQSNNPGVMFASGLESLIHDQMHKPSKYDDAELTAMASKANKKEASQGLFSNLCKYLVWSKASKAI